MVTDLLFVYGTLRRSTAHPMHGLLQPATFVGMAHLRGKLYDLGSYPGVIASDDPCDIVHGEVHRLHDPEATLARLDDYEGCGENAPASPEYARRVVRVWLTGQGEIDAHVYLYQRAVENRRRIAAGDYLAPSSE